MGRLLTLVLLVLLPIQFTWAVAAPYCQHEAADRFHVGHHVHEHLPSPADASQGDDTQDQRSAHDGALTVDNDCSYCHLSVVKTMPVPRVDMGSASTCAVDNRPLASFKFRDPDRHERPNWRLA